MKNDLPCQITEEVTNASFLEEIKKTPAGKKILDCIQCGVCAGSCHARFAMDHSPMQIIKMVHLGLKDDREILAKEFIVYDALYAYCKQKVMEK